MFNETKNYFCGLPFLQCPKWAIVNVQVLDNLSCPLYHLDKVYQIDITHSISLPLSAPPSYHIDPCVVLDEKESLVAGCVLQAFSTVCQ